MIRKAYILSTFLLTSSLIFLSACSGCSSKPDAAEPAADSIAAAVADTAVYGKALQRGMHTFAMVSEAGDTIDAVREDSVGNEMVYGDIFGGTTEGARMAATFAGQGKFSEMPVLRKAVNLDVLEKWVKDAKLWNCDVLIEGDTVSIVDLADEGFKGVGRNGKEYNFGKLE